MKLKNINLGVGKDQHGNLRDASISFSNRNDIGEMISGNFGMTQGEYAKIESGELELHDLIVEKVKELLEIEIESDSLLMVTELKKQVEEKNKTIEELTQSVEQLTKELKEKNDEIQTMITELMLIISNTEEGEEEPTEPEPHEGENNEDDTDPDTGNSDTDTGNEVEGGE